MHGYFMLLCAGMFQTMLFLEQLLEQVDVAGGILAEQGEADVSSLMRIFYSLNFCLDIGLSTMKDTEQANRKAFGSYISKVLMYCNVV